jgi:hypothetical protein
MSPIFDKESFHENTKFLFQILGTVTKELLDKDHPREEWLRYFQRLRLDNRWNVDQLDDSDMPAVNYCRNTVPKLAVYQEIVVRCMRELEQAYTDREEREGGLSSAYKGKGKKREEGKMELTIEHMKENRRELWRARDAIQKAWLLDLAAGTGPFPSFE